MDELLKELLSNYKISWEVYDSDRDGYNDYLFLRINDNNDICLEQVIIDYNGNLVEHIK